jgi:hypothetical protein
MRKYKQTVTSGNPHIYSAGNATSIENGAELCIYMKE